ncbi:MAG: hypothetical protein AB1505_26015, partial [Candidatus Latescibacterota bacterium]
MQRLVSVCLLVALSGALAVAQTPTVDQLPRQSSISQYGITWTFSEPVPVGQFVSGDYYVVGPVTVTRISPAPASGRHGSVLNPQFGFAQGYDDRITSNRYDASLVVRLPLTVRPGDVLISTTSHPTGDGIPIQDGGTIYSHINIYQQLRPWYDGKNAYSPLKDAALLTCLAAPVPTDAFRPPYIGPKDRVFRASQLHRELLLALPRPASTPPIQDFVRIFDRLWIDHHEQSWTNRFMHPTENMPDYGSQYELAVAEASLLLLTDLPASQKEPLLLNFVQVGLDIWGMAATVGPNRGWEALGGHGNGRKWPL